MNRSGEFEIDADTVLQMVEDLDMDNEHETGVETCHSIIFRFSKVLDFH